MTAPEKPWLSRRPNPESSRLMGLGCVFDAEAGVIAIPCDRRHWSDHDEFALEWYAKAGWRYQQTELFGEPDEVE